MKCRWGQQVLSANLQPVVCLADYLDILRLRQKGLEALADDGMVVDDQDSNHSGFGLSSFRVANSSGCLNFLWLTRLLIIFGGQFVYPFLHSLHTFLKLLPGPGSLDIRLRFDIRAELLARRRCKVQGNQRAKQSA
jgi:hypothetical protein